MTRHVTLRLCNMLWASSLLVFIGSACLYAAEVPVGATLVIADFSSGEFKNNLDGEAGALNMDPDDKGSDCAASILPRDRGDKNNTALRLSYRLEGTRPAPNGFWMKLRNLDASAYDHLQFDVKGDGEAGFTKTFKIELKKYKDQERTEPLSGSFRVENVTDAWQTIRIPLNIFTGILDFSNEQIWKDPSVAHKDLDELVIIFHSRQVTQKKGVLYFDNFKLVRTGAPGPTAVDFPPRTAGEKTPTPMFGVDFAKFLAGRLRGFPEKLIVEKDFPKDDNALFREVASDTWKFFDRIVDREHHLPLDQVHMGTDSVLGEGVWIGDYTNVTNIGVYLMAVVSGYDFGFISKEEAVKRLRATLTQMERLEHHESGFLYNYYDTTTIERTSYFVSYVDSAWVVAGLYVAKNAFPEELEAQCERMLGRRNLGFFYDDVAEQMYHGYYANLNAYSNYHYGTFYSESRAGSYMAIARGEVPTAHWFRTARVFPDNYAWQRGRPIGRVQKETLGIVYFGGFYEWEGLRFVPSWGGSAFEALMPQMVLDEQKWAPKGLGENGLMHVRGQIAYAINELGYPVWGMSPCAIPEGGYGEYGVPPMGLKGYSTGVVTPHASILGVAYAPKEVAENIRHLVAQFPSIYGELGFYDAVNVKTGRVAQRYLCLDQAMILISLNNYVNGGAIQKRFHNDRVLKSAEKLLAEEMLFSPSEEEANNNGEDVMIKPVSSSTGNN